jgi:uncharacterized metal-binding protein YceD (DUF177 family)
MAEDTAQNEFCRVLSLDPRRSSIRVEIAADARERAALAKRFGLPAIDALAATGDIRQRPGQRWRLSAVLRAQVVQTCVVTLAPVAQTVEERFAIDFAAAAAPETPDLDLSAEDAEPLAEDGRIDVGEIVSQHLYLALDPFPRAPGAAWPEPPAGGAADVPAEPTGEEGGPQGRPSPFAALAARPKRGSGEA